MTANELDLNLSESSNVFYELDRMMVEYREALKDPSSEESRELARADEIFRSFSFADEPEK